VIDYDLVGSCGVDSVWCWCIVIINRSNVMNEKEKLIDLVLYQIKEDLVHGNSQALAELLSFVPEQYLRGYVQEENV